MQCRRFDNRSKQFARRAANLVTGYALFALVYCNPAGDDAKAAK
ncbi:MAG: hypothetical protein WD875_14425 [Pirellulales bacterium]